MRSYRLALLVLLMAPSLQAQKTPKADSILVHVAKSKADVIDRVLLAFSNAGLTVTNHSGSMIESDQGVGADLLGDKRTRVVRALILGPDSAVTVLISGTETVKIDGSDRRYPINSRSKGTAGKLWTKMQAVAAALEAP